MRNSKSVQLLPIKKALCINIIEKAHVNDQRQVLLATFKNHWWT